MEPIKSNLGFKSFYVFLASLLFPALGSAQQVTFELFETLFNPNPITESDFGARVAFAGPSLALIGARGTTLDFSRQGESYLIDIPSGNLLQTYTNPTPSSNDNFGLMTLWDGDELVLISAHLDDTLGSDTGAVYVFDRDSGQLQRALFSPNPTNNGLFGIHMTNIDGLTLIGAPGDRVDGIEAGGAYLFDPKTGVHLDTYKSPSPDPGDRFGFWTAALGDSVLVTADRDDTGADDAGAAYMFDRVTALHQHTFLNPTPADGDRFGIHVAASGEKVVVGAPDDDTMFVDAGAAYVFDSMTGAFERPLFSPAATANERFGVVGPFGDWVIIGAPASGGGSPMLEGRTYLFDPGTGDHLHTFDIPQRGTKDFFGSGSAHFGSGVLIGSFGNNTGASGAGSAYFYLLTGPPTAGVTSWRLLD